MTTSAGPAVLAALLSIFAASGAAAQPAQPAEADAPSIRRWLDVQHLLLAGRYRRITTSDDETAANGLQWRGQVRTRFLVDRAARLSVHLGAFTGNGFTSGWDNTGIGTGSPSGAFSVKQLFLAVEPVAGLSAEVGSLYVNRGETSEILSYDNDAYLMGERVQWRPSRGPVTAVAATSGYIGDLEMPNVFHRFRHLDEWNYGQLLVEGRLTPSVEISADYTYEDARDWLREGVRIALPERAWLVRAIRAEAYQRVSEEKGAGFNLAADLRITGRFDVSGGFDHVDSHYESFRGFGPLNADRFETGSRVYDMGTYRLTPELSIGWFHDVSVATDYPHENHQRFEILATLNPTETLRRLGVF